MKRSSLDQHQCFYYIVCICSRLQIVAFACFKPKGAIT